MMYAAGAAILGISAFHGAASRDADGTGSSSTGRRRDTGITGDFSITAFSPPLAGSVS